MVQIEVPVNWGKAYVQLTLTYPETDEYEGSSGKVLINMDNTILADLTSLEGWGTKTASTNYTMPSVSENGIESGIQVYTWYTLFTTTANCIINATLQANKNAGWEFGLRNTTKNTWQDLQYVCSSSGNKTLSTTSSTTFTPSSNMDLTKETEIRIIYKNKVLTFYDLTNNVTYDMGTKSTAELHFYVRGWGSGQSVTVKSLSVQYYQG